MGDFRLLGSVEVWNGQRRVEAGQPRQCAVLAALLVDAGRVVPWDVLVDRVWGQAPPADARGTLRAHAARIRQVLAQAGGDARADRDPQTGGDARSGGERALLTHRSGGYVLDVDPDRVDLHRFRRLVAEARDAGPDARRARLLAEAVGLWRGEPLSGLAGAWAARMRESWGRERLDAVVSWALAETRTGNPGRVLAPVGELAGEYPLVESLTGALMRALYAAGRPAEALDQYARLRRRLREELGTDPSAELQALHQAILRGELDAPPEPAPVPVPTPVQSRAGSGVAPAQLPADVYGFTGRADQLARLDSLLADAAARATTAAVISAVSGTAGVGKTALAVHWAHRVASRFPDGQLYVNLRGFDPGAGATSAAEAVRGFLDALGVPPERVPPHLDAQTALYRSLLSGKRVLVVLDNARDAEQARPLLPGTPTAVALVTSRSPLTPLVVGGAHPVALDVLAPEEARELFVRRLGADRVAAEPDALEEIIGRCARLPLALTIAAARAQQTGFSLAAIAAELAMAGKELDALDAGDPATRVRAVFSWSYTALPPPAAELFRLLGLYPGPDISVAAAGSLAGRDLSGTQRLLAELTGANLLAEHRPGRYTFHDLLRVYAIELGRDEDSDEWRRVGLGRLLDHYAHTTHTAALLLTPHREPMPLALAAPAPGTGPEPLADLADAMAWLETEEPVLLAAVGQAAGAGFDRHAWQLAWSINTYLSRRAHRTEQATAWHTALESSGRLGDPVLAAYAHRALGYSYLMAGHHDEADVHYQRVLDLDRQAGDRAGQAHTHQQLAYLSERRRDMPMALDHAGQALALYREDGHERGEAIALGKVGWYQTLLGDHALAVTACEQALEILRRLGDRDGEAGTWDSLGYAHQCLGDHAAAADCYRRALDLLRELGARYEQTVTLGHLGDLHVAAGNPAGARAAWSEALEILAELGHTDAEAVRGKLRDLDQRIFD